MSRQIWTLAKQLNRKIPDILDAAIALKFISKRSSFSSLDDEQLAQVLAYLDEHGEDGDLSASDQEASSTSDDAPAKSTPAPSKTASKSSGAKKTAKANVETPAATPSRAAKKDKDKGKDKEKEKDTSSAEPATLSPPTGKIPTLTPASGRLSMFPRLPIAPSKPTAREADATKTPVDVDQISAVSSKSQAVDAGVDESKSEKPRTDDVHAKQDASAQSVDVDSKTQPTESAQDGSASTEGDVRSDDATQTSGASGSDASATSVESPKPAVSPDSSDSDATSGDVATAPDAKVEQPLPKRVVPTPLSHSSKQGGVGDSASLRGLTAKTDRQGSVGVRETRDLRDARNAGKGESTRRQRDRRGAKQPEPRPQRPVVPTVSFMSQLETREQILEEMRRPPVITSHGDNRVRVLEQPRRPKAEEKDAIGGDKGAKTDAGDKSSRGAAKPRVMTRLAPMPEAPSPDAAPKTAKAGSEGAVLKPIARGSLASPLLDRVRGGGRGEGAGQSSGQGGKTSRLGRGGVDGLGGKSGGDVERETRRGGRAVSQDDGEYSSGKGGGKRNRRDRNSDEGRDGSRSSQRRRNGNAVSRYTGGDDDDFGRPTPRSGGRTRSKGSKNSSIVVTAPRKGDLVIQMPCTVRQFAELSGIAVNKVILKLMSFGVMLTQNQTLDEDTLETLILEFDLKATVRKEVTLEEQYVDPALETQDDPDSLKPRAPVVTFLGHVDHGKTSLLDKILKLHVAEGEKGGITQHIRVYRVDTPRGSITFVDTPGHEAFTEMRARGANCTDIAVLVVAADDGVMPQTEEAISHAKAADVPIVVALNKMDLPGADRTRVIQELAQNDIMPSEWGGDVEIVETSAVTGAGIDELLDTLLTVAELNELKANPDRPATGVTLEASLQPGQGVVCKALVQNGTLHTGDIVLCGASYGRVRSMTDTLDPHKRVKEAGPSVPVSLTGLDVAPEAGSKFVVLDDVAVARTIASERAARQRQMELVGSQGHVTLESLRERLNQSQTQQTLNVIIRADVRGSIEAIRKELGKLEHPEVKVKILQATVGGVTEADVHLADASDAVIVGFNVVPDEGARALAESKKVQIRRYDVIYKLTDDIRAALEGMLKPIEQVKELGRARVQRTFNISHVGVIAGCRVTYGVIERDCSARVIRDNRVIGEYPIESLKRERDEAREVRDGYECGIKLKNFNDVKEGDILEAFKIEEIARTFD